MNPRADRRLRILYCAIDQTVPGTKGGSVHVAAVAEGLARRGHDVHVLVSPGAEPFPRDHVTWIPMRPPFGAKQLRWTRARAVRRVALALNPDVVIERYYNFGGEGVLAGRTTGATTVLEVNAPIVDYPGSPKARLDRALLVRPLRRWRDRICREADVIVTPSAGILPAHVPNDRIVELEWGADTDRFHPGASGRLPFTKPSGILAVFAGAFRSWHGAIHLVRAIRELQRAGRTGITAVLIGDGPELPRVRAEAEGLEGVVITGAVPHADMPACLAAADIGVAPFDVDAHGPLKLGFYWSPLKIFEYMASGLPVVAPAIDRIRLLVADGREGILYEASEPGALAAALERLRDPAIREALGRAARARAVREYSWAAHCEALEAAILRARDASPAARARQDVEP